MRAVVVSCTFLVFALWFLYDATIGYPQRNLYYYYKQSFITAGDEYLTLKKNNKFSEAQWSSLVSSRLVFDRVESKELPKDTNLNQTWPKELLNYDSLDKNLSTMFPAFELWEAFMRNQGQKSSQAAQNAKSVDAITWQYISAYIAFALSLFGWGVLISLKMKRIEADNNQLLLSNGTELPYDQFTKLDTRKWKNKGIAYIYYNKHGSEKKARIDGFMFGGFNKEDENGGPAESLMTMIRANFRGEYI